MKGYIIPLGLFVGAILVATGVVWWFSVSTNDQEETAVSDARRQQCEQFMAVALFPDDEAAQAFLAACLRGEPVLPEAAAPAADEEPSVPEEMTPGSVVGPGCAVGGCSSQLCGEAGEIENMVTTCEYREEYGCYASARCERQVSGQCGWTPTPELEQCVLDATSAGG